MSKLFYVLGLDELHHALRKFVCQVELFAPDSTYFEAEGRRIREEIKILTEKAECWDVLISYNRTIPTCEAQTLRLERERIMASFQLLFAHLEIVYNNEKANPGPKAPLRTRNDLLYSSADSDSNTSSGSNKENVFRPIAIPLQQPQPQSPSSSPGHFSVYSSSSSSSWTSSSTVSYHDAVAAPEADIQINQLPKPKCCRELHFSSGSSSASSANYSEEGNWNQ